MIAIRINKTSEVIAVRHNVTRLKDGEIAVDAIPDAPEVGQYEAATMVYGNGKIGFRIDALPIPEPEEPTPPTNEEISQMRAMAYRKRVDPITCEIQRLRDMGGTEEDIADAMARRDAEVAKIKAELPYTEE